MGWRRKLSPTSRDLQGIWGSSANDVWLVGDGATILRWNGTSLQLVTSPTSDPLTAVWGSSATDVFFVGGDPVGDTGVILHYDGATVQTMMVTPSPGFLHAVWGTGPDDVYVSGRGGKLFHYDGAQWSLVTTPGTSADLRAIWGSGAADVFVVGEQGTVLHFNGTTWSLTVDSVTEFAAIWGSAPNDVYAVSQRREVFHFDGMTWTAMQTPSVGGVLRANVAIIGGTADDVFVVGSDPHPATPAPVLLHFDGSGWAKLVPPEDHQPLNGIWLAPNGDLWAVGKSGYVVRWGGAGWTIATSNVTNTDLRSVASAGSSDAWTVGDGIIRRYDGAQWLDHASGTTALTSVWASGPSFASTVGLDPIGGTIRHYNGTSWFEPGGEDPSELLSVFGIAANDIFAVGRNGVVRHFNGTSWQAAPTVPAPVNLNGVWGTSATKLFAVGTLQSTLQAAVYSFQGSSWNEQSLPGPAATFLQGLWGSSANDVFAVGDALFHFDGVAWSRMTANGQRLHAVSGIGPRDVFAVGDGGTLLHYDGIGWTPIRVLKDDGSAVTENLRGVAATTRSVIVVGDDGFTQRLSFSRRPTEINCRDGWDDDGDGLPDCADPDCSGDSYCERGGTCAIAHQPLTCGQLSSSTVGRASSRDYYRCSPNPETGPDVTYQFVPEKSGPVTVTLDGFCSVNLDLVVVGSMATSNACDPDLACEGAGSTDEAAETVTFTATAGRAYYVIVEGRDASAGPFTLSVTCP